MKKRSEGNRIGKDGNVIEGGRRNNEMSKKGALKFHRELLQEANCVDITKWKEEIVIQRTVNCVLALSDYILSTLSKEGGEGNE